MELDKTTLNDFFVFNYEEEFSIFHKLNFTLTSGGAEMLRVMFSRSLKTIEEINGVQQTLQQISIKKNDWPRMISNGTMMVIMKFYEATLDPIPTNPSMASAYSYKIFHGPDYSLIKYSAGHCFDFLKGMHILIDLFGEAPPPPMKKYLDRAKEILDKPQFSIIKNARRTRIFQVPRCCILPGSCGITTNRICLSWGIYFTSLMPGMVWHWLWIFTG